MTVQWNRSTRPHSLVGCAFDSTNRSITVALRTCGLTNLPGIDKVITSLQGFSKRFTDKKIGQRVSFAIGRRWFARRLPDFIDGKDGEAFIANGILVGTHRPCGRELHKIQLLFSDLLIEGEPFPFSPRRRSRKVPKRNTLVFIRISLTDIVWPVDVSAFAAENAASTTDTPSQVKQPRGFAQGMAGFLAGILPAPGTPPDDQKTPIESELSYMDNSTAITRSNLGSGQREVNENEDYVLALEAFRDLKTKFRRGRMTAEERAVYLALVSKLEGGMEFSAVMHIFAGLITSALKENEERRCAE